MPVTIREKLGPFWFTLDEKDAQSAAFHIRPLTELEFIDVQNEASFRAKRLTLSASGIRSALQYGLLDWRNVNDEAGKPMPYSLAAAERLPGVTLRVIASKIMSVSVLSAAEKKT